MEARAVQIPTNAILIHLGTEKRFGRGGKQSAVQTTVVNFPL